jgi:hypothetical protein
MRTGAAFSFSILKWISSRMNVSHLNGSKVTRANANFYTYVLAASLAWAALNLHTVKSRETGRKFFRVQNMPSALSAQDNHFRFAFALIIWQEY